MKMRIYLLVFLGMTLSLSTQAADQVKLKDGTVLLGSVVGMADGVLHFEASFGGTVAMPWAQVTGLQSETSAVVTMKDGKPVTGTLSLAGGVQQIKGGKAGDTPLKLGEIVSIAVDGKTLPSADDNAAPEKAEMAKADVAAPAPAPAAEAAAPAAAPESVAPEAAAAPALAPATPAPQPAEGKTWAGRAELGLNGQTGNKERFDVRAGIDVNRKSEGSRLNLYLKGQYAETNSERSANEVMGGTRAEWDISERTYVFGKLDLEHDEFEDLEVRATVTTGLGHFFVKREKLELKGWLGAGYEHETFKKDPEPVPDDLPKPTTLEESIRQILLITRQDDTITTTTDEVVAEAGYSYQQNFKKNFRFKHGITYYPSVDDPFSQYRVTADTSMEFPVGKEPDWTVRAGVRNEYDAAPQEDVDKLDTTYYLNLGYNF